MQRIEIQILSSGVVQMKALDNHDEYCLDRVERLRRDLGQVTEIKAHPLVYAKVNLHTDINRTVRNKLT